MAEMITDRVAFKIACAQWIEETIKRGLSPSQMAERMGCSRSDISKMQNRKCSRIPKSYELFNYSIQSGIPLDTIKSEIYNNMKTAVTGQEEKEVAGQNIYVAAFLQQSESEQRMLMQIMNIINNKDKN